MADRKLLVIVIRTPNSDRYRPIELMLKNDKRFELEYIEASMTPTYHDVKSRNIKYSTEIFEYFHERKLMPAEIGCADSHNKARQLIQNRLEGGIIVEDDARIVNVDSFFEMTSKFLSTQKLNKSILNLTGFRQIGSVLSRTEIPKNNKYIKLWGTPNLAVSYALTNYAANDLLTSNQPITYVSDWPRSNCDYFVPLIPVVRHGDLNSHSLIDSLESNFRNKSSFLRSALRLVSPKIFTKKVKNLDLIYIIDMILLRRLKWRLDYLKIKVILKFCNL